MKSKKPNIGNLTSVGNINNYHTVIPFGIPDSDGFVIDPKGVNLDRIKHLDPVIIDNRLHITIPMGMVPIKHFSFGCGVGKFRSETVYLDEVSEVTDEMLQYFKDRKPQLDICLTAGVFDKPPHDLEGK